MKTDDAQDQVAETPITDQLRAVPDGWRTYSDNPDDPMAGSFLHGDLLRRAADEIDRLADHLRASLEERDRLMRFAGGIIGDDFFEYRDVDALWVEEIAAEVGIVVKTTATAEDAKTEWAQEWGIEEGDDCTKMTDFGAKCVHFAIDAARAKHGGEVDDG